MQNRTGQATATPDELYMSEDCLIINVIVNPSLCSPKQPCPVISFMQGGAWYFDSLNHFPLEALIDRWASSGLVVVSPGYRLGVFGFWNTGSNDAIGNYALYDLLESCRWIQKEISAFGGDPNKVTILGYSSSADAVSQLSLSPLSKGLFQRIVAMSGTAYQLPFLDFQDVNKAVAITAGCATESQWEAKEFSLIVECLKKLDSHYLLGVQVAVQNQGLMYHGPRIDGLLLPGTVGQLAENRDPYNLMIGTTLYEEGIPALAGLMPNVSAETIMNQCRLLTTIAGYKNVDAITKRCTEMYSSRKNHSLALLELKDDVEDFAPTFSDADTMRAAGGSVYLYSFDYVKSGLEGWVPFHALDVFYIFRMHWDQFSLLFDQRDEKITNLDIKLISNFAKFGDPTPPGTKIRWRPFEDFNYYKIDLPPSNEPLYHYDAVVFWDKIVPELEKIGGTTSHLEQKLIHQKLLDIAKPEIIDDNSNINWQVAFWITLAFSIGAFLAMVSGAALCCCKNKKKSNGFERYLDQEEKRQLLPSESLRYSN